MRILLLLFVFFSCKSENNRELELESANMVPVVKAEFSLGAKTKCIPVLKDLDGVYHEVGIDDLEDLITIYTIRESLYQNKDRPNSEAVR